MSIRAPASGFSAQRRLDCLQTRGNQHPVPAAPIGECKWTHRSCGGRLYPKPSVKTRAAVETIDLADKASKAKEEEEEFIDFDAPDEPNALTTQQVHALLNVVCDETDIAEVELEVNGFGLKFRRKLTGSSAAAALAPEAAATAPTQPTSANELPFQSTASIDESQLLPLLQSDGSVSSVDEEDWVDENLIYLGAPKVGILRRGRYAKGRKIGKGSVADVGTSVKKGQPVAFIEQLGTVLPIEAPQAGEIVKFPVEDGSAVEYKEVIAEISPFFGGHIIGDKKYL